MLAGCSFRMTNGTRSQNKNPPRKGETVTGARKRKGEGVKRMHGYNTTRTAKNQGGSGKEMVEVAK